MKATAPFLGGLFFALAAPLVAAPPSNDNFANREIIEFLEPAPIQWPTHPQGRTGGSNVDATREPGEPLHAGVPGGKSVWWSFTAIATGSLIISTHGSSFSSVLAVYTGDQLDQLSLVAEASFNQWNDDNSARVEIIAEAGTTYQVAVDGDETPADSGDVVLNLTMLPLIQPLFYRQPVHQYALPGKTVYLSVEARGTPSLLSYQWRHQGTPIAGATNPAYSFTLQGSADYGAYDVVVTNVGGASTSQTIQVEPATGSLVSAFADSRYVASPLTEVESLWHLNHPVVSFTNIVAALSNHVVLFPSLTQPLAPDLTPEETAGLFDFVNNGGILIAHGSYTPQGDHTAQWLNQVFGWSLIEGYPGSLPTLASGCTGTVFATSLVELGMNFRIDVVLNDSLPVRALPVYTSAAYRFGIEAGEGSAVALLPHGEGTVVYLGWNWMDGQPLGTRDGGWLDVLDRATRALDPPAPIPAPVMVNPVHMRFAESSYFSFSFRGYYGKTYRVERSADLITWIDMGPLGDDSPGQFTFLDSVSNDQPFYFYRVRQD